MGAAEVQAVTGIASGETTLTLTLADTAAGNTVVVALALYNGAGDAVPTIESVKLGTASLTQEGTAEDPAGFVEAETSIWRLEDIAADQTSVVITISSATDNVIAATAYEFSGMPVSGTLIDQQTSDYSDTSAWASGDVTTTQAAEVAIGIFLGWEGATFTPTGPASPWVNQTVQHSADEDGLYATFFTGYNILSTTQTLEFSGTGGNTNYWNTASIWTLKAATSQSVSGAVAPLALTAPAGTPQAGATVAGALAPLALAAPAGTPQAGATVAGAVAALALAAPAGVPQTGATIAGAVAGLALAAPAGTPQATGSVAGAVAGLALAAPAGAVEVTSTVAGAVAALALAAPAGAITAGATVAWALAGLTLAAPAGSASGGEADITVTVAGYYGLSAPLGYYQPPAATQPLPVSAVFTPGDWLIAVLTWRQTAAGDTITCSVGDDAHNWWYPLGQPSGTSSADGVTRTAIWAAPAARAGNTQDGTLWIGITPTGFVLAIDVLIFDVAGLSPWSVLELIDVACANSADALAMSLAAPAGNSFVIAASASDNLADTISLAGSGWSSLYTKSSDNGTDHTCDLQASVAWQTVASGDVTADWASTGDLDFSGVLAAITVTGSPPDQPNPMFPWTVNEIAPGAGPGTPIDELTWVTLENRVLDSSFTQGRQYTLDSLQAGQGTMTLDNPDQALIPPGTGSYAGIDSGTPFRTRMAWAGGAWQVEFTGNGSTAAPKITAGTIFTVVPGVTYTASAWLGTSAPWADGVTVSIVWNTGSPAVSAPVTGPAAVLATASGAAPSGATSAQVVIAAAGTPASSLTFYAAAAEPAAGWLAIPAAVTWTGSNGAGVSTLAPWAADPRGAPNISPWYVPQAGYFQRWPPTWDPDMLRGVVKATTTDIWGYANKTLNSALREEILTDEPYAYWPLDDTSGSNSATNIAPGNTSPLLLLPSKLGTEAGTRSAFGTTTTTLLGDTETYTTAFTRSSTPAGMWAQGGITDGSSNLYGYTLQCQDASYPPISGGVTISGFFQCTATSLAVPAFLCMAADVHGPVIIPYISAAGELYFQYRTMSGTITDVLISADSFLNTPGMFHLAIAFNQTSYAAYLWGGDVIVSGDFSSEISPAFQTFSVNGSASRVSTGYFYEGISAHVAIHPRMVPQVRVLSWYYGGVYGFAGEVETTRVARLTGYSGVTGPLVMPDTSSFAPVTSTQDIGDQAAATSLSNIAASAVPALLAVAPTGDLCYLPRSYVYNQPVKWVLGDDQAAGEIPVKVNYSPDYDPSRVVDDIQITQLDDQSVTTPSDAALEAASVVQYGDQTWQPTGYLQNDPNSELTAGPGLLDLANWVAETQSRPYLRVASVTVDAASHPAAWPFAAAAAAGDTATVTIRAASAGGQPVTITGRITQVTRALSFSQDSVEGSATCVFDTAPELNVLTCDDPVRGQLDGTNALAW